MIEKQFYCEQGRILEECVGWIETIKEIQGYCELGDLISELVSEIKTQRQIIEENEENKGNSDTLFKTMYAECIIVRCQECLGFIADHKDFMSELIRGRIWETY